MVLVNRVPNSGTPSIRLFAIGVTLPVWISAAAAFVTAGVTRLVAPTSSDGPNGEALTSVLQSLCPIAVADPPIITRAEIAADAMHALSFIPSSLRKRLVVYFR